jgi:ribosomal protein S18 acetylase RimI-like enzyme
LARPIGHEFEPHVTLGRARHAPYRIEAAITAFGDYRAEVVIDRLTLVELVRPDDGAAVWTPVHEARFGGPAIVARGPMQLELSTTAVVSDPALALLDDVFGPTGQVTTSSGARHGDVATRRVGERQPPADQVVVTARRDGQVLGVLVGRRVGATSEWSSIDAVAVAPEHRGQGIAGHLLRRFDTP